jgi:hypothetical protein
MIRLILATGNLVLMFTLRGALPEAVGLLLLLLLSFAPAGDELLLLGLPLSSSTGSAALGAAADLRLRVALGFIGVVVVVVVGLWAVVVDAAVFCAAEARGSVIGYKGVE